jgi:hypothetical protein
MAEKGSPDKSILSAYLNRGFDNKANRALEIYLTTHKEKAANENPIGAFVHTLIMAKLRRKAEEENVRNRENSRSLVDEFIANKQKSKLEQAELAHKLKLEEEAEKNKILDERELGKRKWEEEQTIKKHQHERELAEQKLRNKLEAEVSDKREKKIEEELKNSNALKNKIEDEKRNTIAKSFGDPLEAIEYLSNPENYEGKLEGYDPRGVHTKILGYLGGGAFKQPTKTRVKKEYKNEK